MSWPTLRNVGNSGLRVSSLGLGCNNFGPRIGESEARAVVATALDSGITHFDTADLYGVGESERILGRCVRNVRDEIVISTKFGARSPGGPDDVGNSRRYIMRACEASLRRLDVDAIDLYYIHKPDSRTPLEETLACLLDLQAQGKIRYAGVSNFAAWQIADIAHLSSQLASYLVVVTQVELNLLARAAERDILPACDWFDLGVVPFFPLASGLLTGKYRPGEPFPESSRLTRLPAFADVATDRNLRAAVRLSQFAEDRGRTILDLAMSWVCSHAQVSSVLFGATSAEQVKLNVAAAQWQLSGEDVAGLASLLDQLSEYPACSCRDGGGRLARN
jgi:aryl-alcohol dehydrogenase-like predicted oxidoreductase